MLEIKFFVVANLKKKICFFPGDKQLKPFLTAEPDIVTVSLDGSEDFLILGCDGFFDVVTPQEAVHHLYVYLNDQPGELTTFYWVCRS